MERPTTAFFLIQIILSITTSTELSRPRTSSLSAQLRPSGRSVQRWGDLSFKRQRRSPSQQDYFSFLTDHRGNYGEGGRPVFGAPNLRSTDNLPPDPDRYWDFVLGSGTFKRHDDVPESAFSLGRVRREATSAGSRLQHFDVLGRRVKGKERTNDAKFQTATEGASNDENVVPDMRELSK